MPIRTTDQPEQFQPLGAPIRQEPAKPAPQPQPVGNGLWRSADGKLETRIPPPAISPAQRQGMWQRDTQHVTLSDLAATQADGYLAMSWDGSTVVAQAPTLDMGKIGDRFRHLWRDHAATKPSASLWFSSAEEHFIQRADWLTITKQVQNLPNR